MQLRGKINDHSEYLDKLSLPAIVDSLECIKKQQTDLEQQNLELMVMS